MGFSFKGIHSDSFKWLGVRTVHNEILPEAKTITIESDFIDGDFDFSESSGRVKYNTRVFEKEIFLKGNNLKNVNEQARRLVDWLSGGYGDLILDENPDLIWTAKVSNQIDFEPQLIRAGKASIYFKAQPLGRYKDKVSISLEESETNFINDGWFCKPTITVNGSFDSFWIKINEVTFNYPKEVKKSLVIDCEKMTVYADASIATNKSYGDFGEVIKGENSVFISAEGDYNAKLEYYPLFLW